MRFVSALLTLMYLIQRSEEAHFLGRAYARKRYLARRDQSHAELLEQLKGLDSSASAAHLSTIYFATCQLVIPRSILLSRAATSLMLA
jgi:hypothetical protein